MNVLLGITGSPAIAAVPKLAEGILNAGHKLIVVSTEFPTENVFMNFFLKDKLKPWTDIDGPGGILDVNGTRIKILSDAGLCQCAILHKAVNVSQSWFDDIIDWPNVYAIAPLSIEALAEIANGLAGNLVTAMARHYDRKKPLIVAPAPLNRHMWSHPFTQSHMETIRRIFPNLLELRALSATEEADKKISPAAYMAPVTTILRSIDGLSGKSTKHGKG